MERRKYWGSVAISVGMTSFFFGLTFLRNQWDVPSTGWTLVGAGLTLLVTGLVLALQWTHRVMPKDK